MASLVVAMLALSYHPMRVNPSARFGAFAFGQLAALALLVAPAIMIWESSLKRREGIEKEREARRGVELEAGSWSSGPPAQTGSKTGEEGSKEETKAKAKADVALRTSKKTVVKKAEVDEAFLVSEEVGAVDESEAAAVLSLALGDASQRDEAGEETAATLSVFSAITGSGKARGVDKLQVPAKVASWFERGSEAQDRLLMAWRYLKFNHGDKEK